MSQVKRKKSKKDTIFIILMLAYPIVHMLFFTFYMNISNFTMSLYRYDGDKAIYVGLYNYINVYEDIFVDGGNIFASFLNSLSLFPPKFFIILPLSVLFSYFLYKKVWGYKTFRVIFFMPSIISMVTLVMAFKGMFADFGPVTMLVKSLGLESLIPKGGWYGSRQDAYAMLNFFLAWSGIGYQILLIQGSMLRIPSEVIESGQLDGVGLMRELVQIVIPLVFSTIATMMLFSVSGIFTTFVQPQLLFGTGVGDRLTLPLYIVNSTKVGGKNGQASAATLGTLITLIGAPIMIGVRALLNKLTPDVEY
ncbi:MAG: sugar ABC transporter permease [Clostridia bacterium]|nr:sugar ABC transporter permease [Clostridia bacterium]